MKKSIFTFACFFVPLAISAQTLKPTINGQKMSKNRLVSIDIEPDMKKMKVINLSQFTNSIKYIPLETKETLPLAWISHIDFSEKFIAVTDMKSCLLFDDKGKFVLKIGSQGRGPGEYQYITNLGFGFNKKIYLSDIFDMLEFNTDGTFIKKQKKGVLINSNEEDILQSWFILADSLYFGHIPNSTGLNPLKAAILNKNGMLKHEFKNYILFNREQRTTSDYDNFANILNFKGEVFYNELYNDTLFSLNDKLELIPRYFFDFGNLKMPTSDRTKSSLGKTMSNYLFVWDVLQTENYLFLKCDFGSRFPEKRLTPITIVPGTNPVWYNTKYVLGLFNKGTGELTFCKPTSTDNPLFTSGLYNDVDGGPRFFPLKQINDSTMVMWIMPDKLKAHVASDDFKNSIPKYPEKKKALEMLAKNLNELDNPVLMIVTFKN